MIKAVLRAAAIVLAPLFILALASCSDAPGEEAEGSPPNPLLYEIASADGTVEGWMVGTIHALPDGTRWRPPAIAAVVDEADLLVDEVGELGGRDEGPSIYFSLAQSPGLPPVAQRLPAELRPGLAAVMERGGIAADELAGPETWAAALPPPPLDATGGAAHGVRRAPIRRFFARPGAGL